MDHEPGRLTLSEDDRRHVGLLAADCAERVLSLDRNEPVSQSTGAICPPLIRSIQERLMILDPAPLLITDHGADTNVATEKEYNPFLRGG